MWSSVLEWCADLFAVTRRGRSVAFALVTLAIVVLAAMVFARVARSRAGTVGLLLLAIFAALAAYHVVAARKGLYRAACLPLSDPHQRPVWHGHAAYAAPTAVSLYRLASAVDAVRRGHCAAANELLPLVDRDLLREQELRLMQGLRAMITLSLGDTVRAAQQAIGALPTGSDDIDTALGRLVITNAWGAHARLIAIDTAWEQLGIDGSGDSSLDRLRRLVKLRIDPYGFDKLDAGEARRLLDDARAVGDEELSAELNALARQQQGYR